MIIIYQKTIRDSEFKRLDQFKAGSWIYVENPTEKEVAQLAKQHRLEAGHLRDALDTFEVPRLEIEKNATYIYTRVPVSEKNRTDTVPLLVVISENFLMTISVKKMPFLQKFTNKNLDFSTTQKIKLFLQIFSEINSSYNASLTQINREVRTIGINLAEVKNQDIIEFVNFETILNDFLSALVPTRAILQTLLSGKTLTLYEDDKDLTEDLLLSNGQLIEICRSNLKNIVNIRESYSTIMTNNLNRVIKMLTSITIVLTIPMIITSLFGMNVALPLADSPFAFYLIIAVTVIAVTSLLVFLNKNRWL